MSAIPPLGSVPPVDAAPLGQRSVAAAATAALQAVSSRVLATAEVVAAGIAPGSQGVGGDVYGLADLARELAAGQQASPADEGQLLRALEEFAGRAALQAFGLQGAAGDPAGDSLGAAIEAGGGRDLAGPDPVAELIARIETAARQLPNG
jgi:hypothetical protein